MNTNRQAATIVAAPTKEDPKVKAEVGKLTHFRKTSRVLIATIAVAALALVLPAAPQVHAAGLTNCVDLSGRAGACYETVWANGVQFRMTFPQEANPIAGATSDHNFYVLAPQTDTPQSTKPFAHDHVVGNVPAHNDGNYVVHLHGFFVTCSAEGITSGGCVPAMTSSPVGPLAKTVNGQPLTSADAIESAANSGLVTPFDTGAVFVAIINP
jgi:hypothetical protein